MKAKIEKALRYPDGYVDISPHKYDIHGSPRNEELAEHQAEMNYIDLTEQYTFRNCVEDALK